MLNPPLCEQRWKYSDSRLGSVGAVTFSQRCTSTYNELPAIYIGSDMLEVEAILPICEESWNYE